MDDIKFSKAREMFYELLRYMFALDVESDQDAVFAKQLVDFIIQNVDIARLKGLEQEMLPVAFITVWQGVKSHNKGIFSVTPRAGIVTSQENNLSELLQNLKETVWDWGKSLFDGVIVLDEEDSTKYINEMIDEDETK